MKNSLSFDILHIQKVFISLIGGRAKRKFRKLSKNCNLSALLNFASLFQNPFETPAQKLEVGKFEKKCHFISKKIFHLTGILIISKHFYLYQFS